MITLLGKKTIPTFDDYVSNIYTRNGLSSIKAVQSTLKTLIPYEDYTGHDECFLGVVRPDELHIPDLFIKERNVLNELKSPLELYGKFQYSKSHLLSYLLQTIFGQSFSHILKFPKIADMGKKYILWLTVPEKVYWCVDKQKDDSRSEQIRDYLDAIVEGDHAAYLKIMRLGAIQFRAPQVNNGTMFSKYTALEDLFITEIEYFPRCVT
jgi:hypothetical protein